MHSVNLGAIAYTVSLTVTSCAYNPTPQLETEKLSSTGFTLISIGEAQALKGYVVYAPGTVVAVELDGKAYSPFVPGTRMAIPDSGIVYDPSTCPIGQRPVAVDAPFRKEVVVVGAAHGRVGAIS